MALTYWEYQVLLVALAWIGGFTPLLYAQWKGTPTTWRWWHAIGLALVLTPFIRMGVSATFEMIALVRTTVTGGFVTLQPFSEAQMWRKVWRHAWFYLIVPAAGLLLIWNGRPRLRDLARAGLAPRETAKRDALHGFTLFFVILVAYVASMLLAYVLLRDVLVSTGDESKLWMNITIPLIIALSGIAGVTEEFLFRGLLLNTLQKRMRWGYAALVQAVFFGVVHGGYGTWAHVLGPFFFGLGMAFVVRHLGLTPAIVLHAGVNVTFFAFDVADVNPAAYGLVAALVALNVYAAYATRFHAVRTLAKALVRLVTGRERRVHVPGSPDAIPERLILSQDASATVRVRDRSE